MKMRIRTDRNIKFQTNFTHSSEIWNVSFSNLVYGFVLFRQIGDSFLVVLLLFSWAHLRRHVYSMFAVSIETVSIKIIIEVSRCDQTKSLDIRFLLINVLCCVWLFAHAIFFFYFQHKPVLKSNRIRVYERRYTVHVNFDTLFKFSMN